MSDILQDPAALLRRCREIGTATWSDALDELGLQGVVSGLPKRCGTGRCAGFAVTVRGEVGEAGSVPVAEFGQDRMVAAAGPTQVLMVELGGAEVSGMGGVVALAARRKGIEAVIIDGGCRDVEDISACGLWVATRHVTPRTGKRRVRLGHFNQPARVGSVLVHAGDLVVGDGTGIVVVPRARIAEAIAIAERGKSADQRMEGAIEAGQSLTQAAAQLKG